MRIDENGDRLDLAGDWIGVVADNADPRGLGRIRARVPGLWEPYGPWLFPKLPGAGSGVGVWIIPPRGARVAVSMSGGGRSTDCGFYAPAGWRDGDELPTEISDGAPEVAAVFNDRYAVVMDSRTESAGASIVDRSSGDIIRLSGTDLSMELRATTAITITSQGSIDITAPMVRINGRPVIPSDRKPI